MPAPGKPALFGPAPHDAPEGAQRRLAVLIDAFVIRGTLVPAFMRLAGGRVEARSVLDHIHLEGDIDLDALSRVDLPVMLSGGSESPPFFSAVLDKLTAHPAIRQAKPLVFNVD